MKLTILSLRQKKKDPFLDLIKMYFDKISIWKVENKEILHKGASDRVTTSRVLEKNLMSSAYTILLDEKGEDLPSQKFSQLLKELIVEGEKNIIFIIGGPEGVDDPLKKRVKRIIRFGRATWPHKMIQLMLMEQLYRAQQILNNHPYHKI